ncbi:caveolin-1-like [Pecten maximus]|uniref:caveolin-1-like n=1 Tax=Pecten maximus TaxID=6579 RepID=UPI001458FF43|nr:caveolin-1-like [Pecten maximus]
MELDMECRDPNALNSNVQVAFDDVIAEPEGAHSIDCVWKNSYWCFNCGKNCCYKFMTFLCGICIALYWGCEFAMIAFDMIWCVTPMMRVHAIYCGCAQKFFGACVNCFLTPICETTGLMFSKITVKNT